MTKDKDIKTVVPALRFPEFRDAEGWKETTLKSISPSIFDGTHQTPRYTDAGVPFYSVENIVSGNKNKFISKEDHEIATSKNCPEKGDVLITRIGTIGFSKVVDWDFDFSIYVTLAVVKQSDDFNSIFLHSYFQSNIYQSEIFSKSLLNAVPCKINMDELRNTRIFLPPDRDKMEQQRIADFFENLDDLISAVADKIEALKEHKKGLMQQLFPADGKTTPTLRFPEFQNAGDWKNKILSDVCKLVRGPFGGALKKEIFVEDGYAVYEQSHAIYGDMNVFRYYIAEDKFNELIRFAVCSNDIIMSCSGTMGKFSIIPNNYKEGVINQALLKLSTKKGYDYRFVKFLLELPSNQGQLLSESAGGAIKNVASVSQIKEMPLCVPELNEQLKIVNCLSSVDELISAEIDKLDQLKAHKKGLMQQLFPNS